MTLATTFEDEPYEYPDGSPVNNATRSYNGTTTIRTAIQNSINVVAVKCLEKVTPDLGLKYLDNFGFTTLAHGTEADKDANGNVWSDANLATALGGITRGVTNVELCASYAAIANGGNYIKPIYYTKISGSQRKRPDREYCCRTFRNQRKYCFSSHQCNGGCCKTGYRYSLPA